MAKKLGRPKTGSQPRDAEVSFSLTLEDAQWFTQVAAQLGFRSRSQFFTAVAERLRIGGLAPFVWLKIGYQIAKLANASGASKGAGIWNPFKERILPIDPAELPPPPLPEPVAAELDQADINVLRKAAPKQLVA